MKNNSGNKRKFHGLIQSIRKRGRIFRMSAYTAGAIMVFLVTYMMILPAITIDKDAAAKQPGMKVSSFAESGQSAGAGTQEGRSSEIAQNSNGTAISDPTESDIPGLPDAKDSQNKGDQQNTDQKENNLDNNNEGKDSDQGQAGSDDGSSSDVVDRDNSQNAEDKSTKDQTGTKNQDSDSSDADKQSNDSLETPDPDSYTMISSPTTLIYEGEDYTVSAYVDEFCMLPEGVRLQVKEIRKDVKKEKKRYQGYYDKALEEINRIDGNEEGIDQESFSFARFFDFSFVKDGQAIEPASPVDISINLDQSKNRKAVEGADAASLKDREKIRVVHFDETGKETQAEEVFNDSIKNTKKKNIDIQFAGESFSVYGVVYTVDFHWEADGKEYDFSMPGGGYMSFYQLVKELKIRTDDACTEKDEIQELVDGVASISFSDPDLVSISEAGKDTTVGAIKHRLNLECEYSAELTKEDIKEINAQKVKAGDWALISLKAFDTEEDLTVTMKNGDEWTVKVTDAQISTMFLSDSGKLYEVTVIYNEKAKIPESSTLRVTEFSEDDSEYDYARKSVLADKKARGEQVDLNSFNLAALDISILDPKGKEIEPASTVRVDIRIKALPGVENLEEIKESLEIQHHVEVKDGVVVETVFDGSSDASFRLETNEKVVKEGTVVDPNSIDIEEVDNKDLSNDGVNVSFETNKFSTFTVTWNGWNGWNWSNRNTTIHYGYMDGTRFVEFDAQPSPVEITQYNRAYLIYDFEGYQYSGNTYYRTSASSTPASGGTRIQALLRYNNGWQYRNYSTNASGNWSDIANNSHIYVVYEPATAIPQGGTAVAKKTDDTQDPAEPEILKESSDNHDGTRTLSLSVTGHTEELEVEKLADVIVVFDTSGSMQYNMAGNSTYYNNQRRLAIAKNAVNAMAQTLLSKTNSSGGKLIRMSLISFNDYATVNQGFTDNYTTFSSAVNNLGAENGTNWEHALKLANQMSVDPERATFVIFVSDGDPTSRVSRMNATDAQLDIYNKGTDPDYLSIYHIFGTGSTDPYGFNYDTALNEARSIVNHKKNFYTIAISNDVSNMAKLTTEAGGNGTYTATTSTELENAFNDIAASITAMMGQGDIKVTDGITALTQTVQKSSLVNIAADDFMYYKGHAATTEDVRNGLAASVGDMVWESWTPFTEGCAEAVYNTSSGAVEWNMGESFMLEEGITYQVRFKVWPSQEAYDYIAKLNNGTISYEELDQSVRDQIIKDGNTYTLKTNEPNANTTYRAATKTGNTVTVSGDPKTLWFQTVKDLNLSVDKMKVQKEWVNSLDPDARWKSDVELHLTDGAGNLYKSIELNEKNNYSAEDNFISCGLAKIENGELVIYEKGHDFKLTEPEEYAYYWDLDSQIYRPMIINAQLTMLVKTDAPAGMGSHTYYVDQGTSYYKIDGGTYQAISTGDAAAAITATNIRRSNLNLTKKVVDENGDPVVSSDMFTFTITINDTKDADIWFSVQEDATDTNTIVKDLTTNATPEMRGGEKTGYYHAPSGSAITVSIQPGWNLRFTNLPNGTTYTITETAKENYTFVNAAIDNNGTFSVETGTTTGSGTINESNTQYTVTYTNQAVTQQVYIQKTAQDAKTPLQGAVFSLYGIDGYNEDPQRALKTNLTSDANGKIDLGRLAVGEYYLVETKAPAGYILLSDPVEITVKDTGVLYEQITNSLSSSNAGVSGDHDQGYTLVVTNNAGYELPSTGGPGTRLYTILGSILIFGAGVLLWRRRRTI